MDNTLSNTLSLLACTPAALSALLRDLPDSLTQQNEGPGTWSPYDIVAHLHYNERTDWMPRVKIILQFGESRTFDPFDRERSISESQGKSLGQLLDDFAQLRARSLSELRALNLGPRELALRGSHPVFGPVTLAQLLATWPVHDLTHFHQLSRVLAHPQRAAVGPWSVYLGVLQCAGHSSQA
jgi:hypothetical protein